jgi:hypothetical protein
LSDNAHNITLLGNFDITSQQINISFQHTGIWYEFFNGTSLNVSGSSTIFTLNPGEYRLYSDKELPAFKDLATGVSKDLGSSFPKIYPNPVSGNLHIDALERIEKVELYTFDGKQLILTFPKSNRTNINLNHFITGIYFVRILTNNQVFTKKIVKN